jgi:hypothetical protein
MCRRHLAVTVACPLLWGCLGPAPAEPEAPPPVVEVSPAPPTADEPDGADEGHDEPGLGAEEPDDVEPDDEELSEAEKRQQEVADALSTLQAKPIGSGAPWGSGGSGMTGGFGGLGTGGRSVSGQPVKVRPGKSQVRGALDKEIIRRVVRKHMNAYRHCYENALLGDPDLEGKVELKFVIAKSGAVSQATVTTGIDKVVDHCVKGVALRMMFPKPNGGGVVIVNYPFVFRTDKPKTFRKQAPPPSHPPPQP